VVFLVAFVGLVAVDAVVVPPFLASIAPVAPDAPAADTPDPLASARAPGEEIAELRDASSSTYATETPGVYRTVFSQDALNYRTDAGWERIDPTLRATADGSLRSTANAFTTTIGAPASADLAHIDLGDGTAIGWSLEGGVAPTASVRQSGTDTVEVAQAEPGVTIEMQSVADGLKETLVLDRKDVPSEYEFPLSLQGLTPRVTPGGDVELTDAAGARRAVIPRGWMEDSSGNPESNRPADASAVRYDLVPSGAGQALRVTLDRAWLDDPARVYPVRVDPTTRLFSDGTDPFDDTYTNWFGGDHRNETYLQVGKGSADNTTLLHFDPKPTSPPAAFVPTLPKAGIRILDLDLTMSVETGTTCSVPLTVELATSAWPTAAAGATLALDQSCPWGAAHTVKLRSPDPSSVAASSFGEAVRNWIAQPSANFGLRVHATATNAPLTKLTSLEGDNSTYDAPALNVVWSYKPEHLKVNGNSGLLDEVGGAPVTYGSPVTADCYPEYSQPVPAPAPYVDKPAWWNTTDQCKADLYWKGSTPLAGRSVAILVHGGGFMATNNVWGTGRRSDVDISVLADALAERGYVVAVIDYHQSLYRSIQENYSQFPNGAVAAFALMLHCIQRTSTDPGGAQVWPGPAGNAAPPIPAECLPDPAHGIPGLYNADGTPTEMLTDLRRDAIEARRTSVRDIQAATAWLRAGAGGRIGSDSNNPSKVFVLGESAGGVATVSANYDPLSVGPKKIDGAISIGGSSIADPLHAINDPHSVVDASSPSGALLPPPGPNVPNAAAPLQVQEWEHDFIIELSALTAVQSEKYAAGMYDFGRETAATLRTKGYTVDFRSGCGFGHVWQHDDGRKFSNGFGEAIAFLNDLNQPTPVTPFKSLFATNLASRSVGQDLVEDEATTTGHTPLVADFNGDAVDDILWWSATGCNTAWYGQGDGSFSRTDLSYPGEANPPPRRVNKMPAWGDPNANHVEQRTAKQVVTGDFNGDALADIFWFTADPAAQPIWYSNKPNVNPAAAGDPYKLDAARTATFTSVAASPAPDLTFQKAVAGDFDRDGFQDLFFYKSAVPVGGGPEVGTGLVWRGQAGTAGFVPTAPFTVPASAEIAVGHFDGLSGPSKPIDQLLFWSTASGPSATLVTYGPTPITKVLPAPPAATKMLTGNFDGDTTTDIYWYNAASSWGDNIWYGPSTWTSTPPTIPGFQPVAQSMLRNGAFDLSVGDFDADGRSDIYFRSQQLTGWELDRRGPGTKTALVAGPSPQFEAVPNNRNGIVGRFHTVANVSTSAGDDILWHFPTRREDTGVSVDHPEGWRWLWPSP
jgi:hypothetical protein